MALGSAKAAAAPAATAETTVELLRFDGVTRYLPDRGTARRQQATIHRGPPPELRVEFLPPATKEWAVVAVRPEPKLPANLAGRSFHLDVDTRDATGVIGAALRLRDASGEVHQWRARLAPDADRQTLRFTIELGVRGHHAWSGDGNKTFDGDVVLSEIALETDANSGGLGLVRVHSLKMEVRPEDPASLPRANFVPARRTLYFTEGERAGAAIRLNNDGFGTLDTTFEAELRPPGGAWTPWQQGSLRLAPGETRDFFFGEQVNRLGVWSWRIRTRKGDPVLAGSFAFVDLPGHLPTIDGIDLAITGVEEPEDAKLARALGARTHRVGLAWHELSPSEGVNRWDRQDELFKTTLAAGLRIQTGLGYSSVWAAEGAPEDATWRVRITYPPRVDAWRDYVRSTVERYRGRVFAYEVWNEPDLEGFYRGSTEQYLELLRIASEEIRRADPQALVMSGGFATVLGHGGRRLNPDIQVRTLREAAHLFDLHVLHQHGLFDSFYSALTGPLDEMRRDLPQPRPLYFNETSVGTQFTDAEDQAKTLPKKFTFAASHGAVGYNWFIFRGRTTHTNHYAMVDMRNGEPRPVFVAYAALARELAGLRYDRRIDIGEGRFAFLFSGPERHVLVAWTETDSAGDAVVHATLGSSTPRARAADLLGNDLPVAHTPHGAFFQVGRSPAYFELPAAPAGPALALAVDVRDRVTVRNPGAQPLALRFGAEERTLASGHDAAFEPTGTEDQVSLTLAGHTFALRAPARSTFWLSEGDRPETPTFHLSRPAQVRNFFENDPRNEDKTWQGPEDLSADAWLTLRGDTLQVRIDVRDDSHRQTYSGWDIWRGDSVQLALANPAAGQRENFWVFGLSRRNTGEVEFFEWSRPPAGGSARIAPRHSVTPIPGGMRYEIDLPLAELGLAAALRETGLGFNLVVNDSDADVIVGDSDANAGKSVRKGYIQLADGLATRRDASNFPTLRIKP